MSNGWEPTKLLAVDAGVHLSAISKILEGHKSIKSKMKNGEDAVTLIDGPFDGLQISYSTATAQAGYIAQEIVGADGSTSGRAHRPRRS